MLIEYIPSNKMLNAQFSCSLFSIIKCSGNMCLLLGIGCQKPTTGDFCYDSPAYLPCVIKNLFRGPQRSILPFCYHDFYFILCKTNVSCWIYKLAPVTPSTAAPGQPTQPTTAPTQPTQPTPATGAPGTRWLRQKINDYALKT